MKTTSVATGSCNTTVVPGELSAATPPSERHRERARMMIEGCIVGHMNLGDIPRELRDDLIADLATFAAEVEAEQRERLRAAADPVLEDAAFLLHLRHASGTSWLDCTMPRCEGVRALVRALASSPPPPGGSA